VARLFQRSQDVGLVKLVGFVGHSSLDYNRVLQPPRHGGLRPFSPRACPPQEGLS
jgi:hypothetical protein